MEDVKCKNSIVLKKKEFCNKGRMPSIAMVGFRQREVFLSKLQKSFLERGWYAELLFNSLEVLRLVDRTNPELVVVDLTIHNHYLVAIIDKLRSIGYKGGIIVLTERYDEAEEVLTLEVGADNYIHYKGFNGDFNEKHLNFRLMLEKFKRVFFRTRKKGKINDEMIIGDMAISKENLSVMIGGKYVEMGSGHFMVLWLLANNKNRVVSYRDILEFLYGTAQNGSNTVPARIYVSGLRQILGEYLSKPSLTAKPYITTIRGVGYRLNEVAFIRRFE